MCLGWGDSWVRGAEGWRESVCVTSPVGGRGHGGGSRKVWNSQEETGLGEALRRKDGKAPGPPSPRSAGWGARPGVPALQGLGPGQAMAAQLQSGRGLGVDRELGGLPPASSSSPGVLGQLSWRPGRGVEGWAHSRANAAPLPLCYDLRTQSPAAACCPVPLPCTLAAPGPSLGALGPNAVGNRGGGGVGKGCLPPWAGGTLRHLWAQCCVWEARGSLWGHRAGRQLLSVPGVGTAGRPQPCRPPCPGGGKRARLGRRVPTAGLCAEPGGAGGVVKPPLRPTATRGQWQVQPPPPQVRGPRGRDVWRRREGARPAVLSPWDEAPIPAPTPPAPAAREARGDASCPNVSRSVRCGPLKPLCLAK